MPEFSYGAMRYAYCRPTFGTPYTGCRVEKSMESDPIDLDNGV